MYGECLQSLQLHVVHLKAITSCDIHIYIIILPNDCIKPMYNDVFAKYAWDDHFVLQLHHRKWRKLNVQEVY